MPELLELFELDLLFEFDVSLESDSLLEDLVEDFLSSFSLANAKVGINDEMSASNKILESNFIPRFGMMFELKEGERTGDFLGEISRATSSIQRSYS